MEYDNTFHFSKDDKMGVVVVVDKPIPFVIGNRLLSVPKGFVSDGASVPRSLWWLLSPCISYQTLYPSIAHDYLYESGIVSRKEADEWYRDALLKNDYPRWKTNLTYWGVRAFGSSHYTKEVKK